jgi:thymidine kinase
LADAKNQVIQSDVIGIDEGQFYLDIVDFCDEMANMGKIIIVAALDGDYKRRPFNRILELIPKAENIVKKSAVCFCGDNASFSKRLCDSTEVEMVGGSEWLCVVHVMARLQVLVSVKKCKSNMLSLSPFLPLLMMV